MPLDSTNWLQTETETKPDLSKPSLEGLSWLLRHLPETHKWDFAMIGGQRSCGSAGCALGLAQVIWPEEYKKSGSAWAILPARLTTQAHLFSQLAYGVSPQEVTPTMVADRIDKYLAETRK